MPVVQSETVVAAGLRDFLLRALPAQVASVNAGRYALLLAPFAGPYTVLAGQSYTFRDNAGTVATYTQPAPGSVSAATLATALQSAFTGAGCRLTASADTRGRLSVVAQDAPASSPSLVELLPETVAGSSLPLGWDAGGNVAMKGLLVAPTYRNIYDGVPMVWDLGGEGVINVIIGDRSTTPLGANIRNDQHNVTLDVHVLVASPQ